MLIASKVKLGHTQELRVAAALIFVTLALKPVVGKNLLTRDTGSV